MKTQKTEPRKPVVKKPEETERQKFHRFYLEVYLKDGIVPGEPHHADKHGILGYEDNNLGEELHTKADGTQEVVNVIGLCKDCTKDRESAKKAFEKYELS